MSYGNKLSGYFGPKTLISKLNTVLYLFGGDVEYQKFDSETSEEDGVYSESLRKSFHSGRTFRGVITETPSSEELKLVGLSVDVDLMVSTTNQEIEKREINLDHWEKDCLIFNGKRYDIVKVGFTKMLDNDVTIKIFAKKVSPGL